MPRLYAQPYDITANGFYFESLEDYTERQIATVTITAAPSKSTKSSSSKATRLIVIWRKHGGSIKPTLGNILMPAKAGMTTRKSC